MMFERPWALVWIGIALLILCVWSRYAREPRSRVQLNIEHRLDHVAWTWRRSTVLFAPILQWFGIALLVLAAARPFDWLAIDRVDVEGIAINLVIDRSGSMLHDDYQIDCRRVSRLHAVAQAASEFIVGDESLGSRANDMIGLITFARFADRACPLTLDHEQVIARLERLTVARDFREDGTAIGDGLSLAIADLESLRASLRSDEWQPDLTRIVVLLTDGQDNASQIDIPTAIELAVHYGVRVYVLGLEPEFSSSAAARERLQIERQRLSAMANATGGQFFAVGDSESLREVYQAIHDLERRPLGQQPLRVKRHWAVSWFEIATWNIPPIMVVALVCLVTAGLLRRTACLQPLGGH
jgi:Ca-activated chloride channel homolog